MTKKTLPPELIIFSSLIFFVITFAYFNSLLPQNDGNYLNGFVYFLNSASKTFTKSFFWLFIFLFFVFVIRFLILVIPPFWNKSQMRDYLKTNRFKVSEKKLFPELKNFGKIVLPVFLSLYFLTTSLTSINAINRHGLKDEALINLDKSLTGGYPFIAIQTINYPLWFIKITEFSFQYLLLILVAFGFLVLYKNRRIALELSSAFCLSLVLMLSLWLRFPALSPQDRFIDNVYNLPVPPQIKTALASYHPQKETANFLAQVREKKNKIPDMPTTTIPSAHIAFGLIFGYYIWRTRRLWGLVFLPILIFSSLGTNFFAQHYFVDVPAGIIIAAASIALTQLYFAFWEKRKTPLALANEIT